MSIIKSFGSSSKGNSILAGDILLDCGVSPDKIFPKPKVVLITHSHGDHIKYMNHWMKRGITCYCGEIKASAFGKPIRAWELFSPLPDVTVQALPAVHDTSNALSFVIDMDGNRIFYEVDSAKRGYMLDNVTHYIAECNWDEASLAESIGNGTVAAFEENRLRSTHKSLEILLEELETMDKSRLKEIWLAHGSERNLNKELAKLAVQEATGVPVYFA